MASTFRITLRNGGIGGPKATKLTSQEAIGEEMAMRKAEEAASRRFEAVKWLRQMDRGAVEIPLGELSEEEFCFALRNGLILCNVLNKVIPGAIPKVFKRVQFDNQAKLYSLCGHYEFTHLLLCSIDISKVVDNPAVAVQLADGTAQSAIQYFENMRNFLVSVNEMKLLTFEASDLEKGGSSFKVVDCILCLKAYHEWKLAGGIGIWRYGGIVKISSSHRGFPSTLFSGASTNESSDRSDMIHDHQLLDVLHLLAEVFLKDFKVVNFLSSFDQFGVRLLETLLIECTDAGEFFLNDTLIDTVLELAVKEFSALLVNRKNQLSVVMKKTMGEDNKAISKATFFEGISKHFEEFWSNPPSYRDTSSDASNLDVLQFQHKQLEKLKLSFNDLKAQVERDHAKWEEDLRNFRLYIQGLELNTSSYYKLIEENRFLYNELQDLKGCIRVYCRVRPFLTNISDERSTIDYIGENGSIIIKNPHKQGRDARKIFSFNRVFGMNSTQSEVFADTKSLIRSVLDGYNVCIFAYGQTGSGKTYTMSGANLSAAETWGVNYRALNDMFNISKSRARIVNYDVSVQMVEIYNEQVRDLLVTDGCMRSLDIRNNSQLNGLNIPDAKLFAVTCTQDVLDLMKAGLVNRAVGATALNERSSRSHSVLTIHVEGKELASGSILKSCLHLVDLAGSERVEKSEVTGERLKEAQHINRSLSALGDVISALAQKSSHIPYRNSKLTQVLQDSLGGQAKTLMLVHINPEIKAFGETISTLKFAERVSSIELGASRVNKEIGELRELKEEVSSLKSKLESKEMEVQKLKEYLSLADSEMHNNRAISPSNLQKCNFILNNESIQRPLRNPGVIEFSSSSSGNQRKPHFGMTFLNKESMVKDLASRSPLSAGDSCMISRKIRSPSPPIRRSTSTDRASIIKTKTRIQTISGRPLQKLQFPEPITINKSTASVSRESTIDLYIHKYLQEQGTSRRILHESDDQSRQALAIRKNKMDSKFKYQREPQKSDINYGVIAENIQLSETEMNCGLTNSLTGSAKVRKFQSVVAGISKTMESRISIEEGEKFPRGKHENKPPNCLVQNGKEGISCNPKSELRRSRSLPRGKFMFS